ncbi:interferon-induced 6-16 family protein [Ceratobasidium sp. AG-Ba]|nr:interferon-induced 6-16 family protein [Ceratobasidium sp. AG-Ba]QRV99430.1 interferon-induced 6-16 family protein [Ceratobasidium sp. AG-Ba]QRW13937.1 interferon-induced 6-16 family protein [Ceratobasidium sp. AG-Ba]
MGNVVNAARFICSTAVNMLGNTLRAAGNMISWYWQRFSSWIFQPHIYRRIFVGLGIAGAMLLIVPLTVTTLGSGPAGIIAGSAAAGIQSVFYGGFVPAGGLFAALTSNGMTGALVELATVPATIAAVSSVVFYHNRHSED